MLDRFVGHDDSAGSRAQNTAAPAQAAPAATTQAPPTANAQQAYTLPPDKLAKAIALNRIRNILNITGSIWGIVFVWLLLALGAWAAVERWAQRITGKRWVQGLRVFRRILHHQRRGRASRWTGSASTTSALTG